MISSSALQKVKSLVTLVAFCYSLFTPLFNIAFAVAPTVNLTYSANPAGAGLMTVTATYSESIVGTPLISIDQPGTTDIVDATMLDLGTGSSWSYDYTVNVADGSGYIDGTANVTLTGAYNGTGEIADPASNATFDIMTADIVAPVVTLSGSTPEAVFSGGVFFDEGATWTDNVDGTGTISAYNSGTLDVNNSGTYLISYVYVDAAGNTGSVDRLVAVLDPDIFPPVVTLSGSTPMDVEFGGPFVDPGATWTDNVDGSGVIAGYNSGTLDVNTLGAYTIGYEYMDLGGNTGSIDRVVNVVDTTAPVVTLSGSTPVTVLSGSVFNDEGATWNDAVDGTGIIIGYNSGNLDMNNSGSYLIGYVYVDVSGNTGTVNRVVNVVDLDVTAPVVTLSGATPVDVEFGGPFVDDGATWTDNVDGTGNIGAYNSGSLDVNTLGTYNIGYVYVDVVGNTGSVDRVVNVVDTTAPVVTLSGSNPVTVLSGSMFSDDGATWSDAVDGTGTIIGYNSGNLDMNNSGSYLITYFYVDGAGNTGSVDRVVNVEGAPVPPQLVPATILPPIDSGVYSDITQEIGRIGIQGGTDNIRIQGFEMTISGSSNFSSGIFSPYIVDVDSGTIIPATASISGQNITFSSMNFTVESGNVKNIAIHSSAGDLSGNYGNYIQLLTSSAAIQAVYESSGSAVTLDDSGFNSNSTKTYLVKPVSPQVTLSGSNTILSNERLAFVTVQNNDTETGITLSGITINVSMNYGAVLSGNICLRDYGSMASCGSSGTTSPQPIDQSGGVYTFLLNSDIGQDIASNGSYINYEIYLEGGLWLPGESISFDIGDIGYESNSYEFSENYLGMTGASVTVTKIDTDAPIVTINGVSPTDVEFGGPFVDDGATWTDNVDGTGNIGAYNSGSLDVNTLGTYNIGYVYVDAAGNTGSVDRVVNVVDTTAPVVTLSGSNPVNIFSGGVFTDDGATWTDNVDGTGNIGGYNSGTVDVNNTGSYTVSYVYVDAAGNTGSVDRVVNVVEPDVTAPVLSLSGSSPIDVEFGGPYVDEGATWTDNVDGSGFITGFNSGSLDVEAIGPHIITYVYVDMAGNTGSVDRVVNIVDTTAPIVTLSGSSPVTIFTGGVFIDEGATWSDVVDGGGTIVSYNSGILDVNNTGSYLIGYVYVDGAGNTGSVDRVVNVVEPDVTAPVLSLSGSSPIDVEYAGSFVDDGATWTDNVDGSGTISTFNSGTLDINTIGTYLIGYVYVDAAGNTGSVDRVVNVVDTTAPVLSLSGVNPVNIFSGGIFMDEGATWSDAADGTGVVASYNSGTLDVNNTGSYQISYVYVDSSGNTGSVDRVVNVMDPDTTPPTVTLYGISPIDIEFGSIYTDLGAEWSDNFDGTGNTLVGTYGNSGSFAMSGSVDTNTLGAYPVEYYKVDNSGNAGSAIRTVNVVDTTAPVVTLSGSSPVTILSGSVFTDEGAIWSDAVDGTGVIMSATSGSVDVNTLGTYVVDYSYTDISGNTGSTSRIVNVVAAPDIVPPVVTLVGSTLVNVEYGSSFIDLGATWTDNVDGTGSISSYTSGSVNTGSLGTYIVSYEYVDSSGNTGSTDRTVNIVDTVAPTASVSYSTLGTTSGSVIATLTGSSEGITIVNNAGSPNYTFIANGSFTYTYIDASGNTGTTMATVNNIDTTPPVISIVEGSSITVALGSTYIDQGATANDNISGNLTAFIVASGSVNTSLTGTYIVEYSVSDSAGNRSTVNRTVNVSPIVSAPAVYNIGGGGGGSAGSYVSYFSAPTNAFELSSDNQQSSSNSQSMTLGIANLQRLLNLSLSQEQLSEPSDSNIPSGSESTPQAFEPITEDIDGRLGETEIIYLIQRGIINNSSNFNPDRTMTRGEFIKIVSGFYESSSETSLELPFADIESDEMRKYIEIAYSYGLITRQNLFRPNDPITTGEAKTILMRSEGTSGEGNLFLSEKNTITRENGAIIIVSWLADRS